jgi:hypothetical protein
MRRISGVAKRGGSVAASCRRRRRRGELAPLLNIAVAILILKEECVL